MRMKCTLIASQPANHSRNLPSLRTVLLPTPNMQNVRPPQTSLKRESREAFARPGLLNAKWTSHNPCEAGAQVCRFCKPDKKEYAVEVQLYGFSTSSASINPD